MIFKNFVTSFVRQWNFVRSETLDILNSLTDEQLKFKPVGSPNWQPLHYQFACMARTQMVYARAIAEGKMDFSWFEDSTLPDKHSFKTKAELVKFLDEANKKWREAIVSKRYEEEFVIAWPGFKQSVPNHIVSLISHERIHHGELISYFTMAGYELPKDFKRNWAL